MSVFLLGAWVWVALGQGEPGRFSLKAALDRALEASTVLKMSQSQVEEAQARLSAAWSALLPTMSLTVGPSTLKDNVFLGQAIFNGEPYNLHSAMVRARQGLTLWGVEWRQRSLANQNLARQEYEAEVSRRDLIAKVIALYVKIQRLDRERGILSRHRAVLADLEQVATHKRAVGRFSSLDLMEIQSERALLEPSAAQLEVELGGNLTEFRKLLGSGSSLNLETSLETLAERAKTFAELEVAEHPDLRRAEMDQEVSQAEAGLVLAKHLPTLQLYANYGKQAFAIPDLVSSYATSWSFGLEITIPLFSGLSSLGESRASAARSRVLELRRQETLDAVVARQVRTREAYAGALKTLDSSEKAYALSEKAKGEGQRGYRDGRYDFLRYFRLEESRLRAELTLARAFEGVVRAHLDRAIELGHGAKELLKWGEGS